MGRRRWFTAVLLASAALAQNLLPRPALVRLRDDLRQAVEHGALADDDRQAAVADVESLESLTRVGRRPAKQDVTQMNTVLSHVHNLLDDDKLASEDRRALTQDLKALEPPPPSANRQHLRNAIKGAPEDANSYPSRDDPRSPPAAGDNSIFGGWRKVPATAAPPQ